MEGGFFVVGDAVGGGEYGGFYEGEAHDSGSRRLVIGCDQVKQGQGLISKQRQCSSSASVKVRSEK